MPNIVEVAVANGQFTTLVTALKAAGLVDALSGDGPFTVLAPNDAAFAKVGSDKLNEILADKEALKAILTYHVLAGRYTSTDLDGVSTATTLQGEDVEIRVDGDVVKIDSAHVIKADIEASNGVIHVIDTVLIPEAAALVAQA